MFSLGTAKGKVALIADIDDISVGVAIVELSASGPVALLTSDRVMLPIENRDARQSVAGIAQALEQCADKVIKAYIGNGAKRPAPEAVHIILRTPWTRFRTAQAEKTFPESRATTKDMIADLAKKAVGTITDLDTGNILEAGVMQVFLNGYPTGNPLGKRAQSIAVTAFESDVNPEIKRAAINVLGKLLPGRTPTVRSGMRALLAVLHELIPDVHRYCLLDVGGTATSCAIVRKESVTQHDEAPEGFGTIIKKVSGAGLPEETLTQLRMLAADTCSTDACRAIKDALGRAEPELAKTYGEMFAKLAQRRRLPNHAILSAPGELLPWLQNFFERIDFAQFTATTQPFEVEALTPEHLQEKVVWKTGARHDVGLVVAAGCVTILEQSA
ncbi:MAG TPA: hypothetical protein VNM40_01325 [Candidatus Paceibacterota bacterium]|nr:hypothetical protein [Candidatus Paceibacterota bacterium]